MVSTIPLEVGKYLISGGGVIESRVRMYVPESPL